MIGILQFNESELISELKVVKNLAVGEFLVYLFGVFVEDKALLFGTGLVAFDNWVHELAR